GRRQGEINRVNVVLVGKRGAFVHAVDVVVELERWFLSGAWGGDGADGDDLDLWPGADHGVSGGAGDHCHGCSVAVGVDVVAAAAVDRARRHELGLGVGVDGDAGV